MSPIELGDKKEVVTPEKGKTEKDPKGATEKKEPKISREQKIQNAFNAGKPFTFSGKKKVQKFQCVCGAYGQNAIVLKDKNEKEVLIGNTCVKKFGVDVPKAGSGNRKVDL